MGIYKHINFKPPQSVAGAAEKGLEYRRKAKPSNRGGLTVQEAAKEGIGSGVQRASNLKNRSNVSPKVIKQMVAFFSRHEKNKAIGPENRGTPWKDKGYVAWLLWGGDSGKAWANKVLRQMEAADEKEKTASKIASRYLIARKDRSLLRRAEKIYQKLLKAIKKKPSPLLVNGAKPSQLVLIGGKSKVPGLSLVFDLKESKTFLSRGVRTFLDRSTKSSDVIVVGLKGFIGKHGPQDISSVPIDTMHRRKNEIIHEIVHYIDRQRMGEEAFQAAFKSYKLPTSEDNLVSYFNHPLELNAYFLQALSEATKEIEYKLSNINPKKNDFYHQTAVAGLAAWLNKDFQNFRKLFWLKYHSEAKQFLTPQNKRRQDKRVYDTWSKLHRKAQKTMDYLIKSKDEMAQKMKTGSRNPIKTLKTYLEGLNRLVGQEDYDALGELMESVSENRKLAKLIGDADEFLTDKRRASYARDAQEILEGGTAIVHLSDGGYSRLSLRMLEAPFMWMDEALSTAKPKERWKKYRVASPLTVSDHYLRLNSAR